MIKIKMKITENIFNCKISGHSGYDEYGKDIVCASISTLILFLECYKRKKHEIINSSIETGNSDISVIINGNDAVIDTFIEMVCNIAEQYPNNVTIKYDK